MKAHKIEKYKRILLVGLAAGKLEAARQALEPWAEAICLLEADESTLTEPVGWLAARPGMTQAEPNPRLQATDEAAETSLSESTRALLPCLILNGFSSAEMDQVLAVVREAGLFFPLKAVVTPTNRMWPLGRLLEELRREREQILQSSARRSPRT